MISQIVNRPIAVMMCFLLLAILGVLASFRIPTSLLPETDIPRLVVSIANPGVSPEEFDKKLIEKLRNALVQIEGLTDLNTYTSTSKSEIQLVFDFDFDIDLAYITVNEKLDQVLALTTIRVDRPVIRKFRIDEMPSVFLSASWSDKDKDSLAELSFIVQTLVKRRLEQQSEISFVDISGIANEKLRINIDESATKSLGISMLDVTNLLKRSNVNFGSVDITDHQYIYSLSLENRLQSLEEIKNLQFKVGERLIPLSQFATIERQTLKKNSYLHNLRDAVSFSVIKNPKVQTSQFSLSLNQVLSEIRQNHPEISIVKTSDQTELLTSTIHQLSTSLLFGTCLAIMSTFLFLRSLKNAIIIFLTVIVSLLIDLLLFYLLGLSINLISLSGLILGMGLMIDSIIIVLESIEQKSQELLETKEGAIEGANSVIVPLISSTLTTCAIFIPLVSISGLSGLLFYDQAMAVTIALVSSLVTSLALLPTVYNLLYPRVEKRVFTNVAAMLYHKWYKALSRKKGFLVVVVGIMVCLGVVSFLLIKKEQLPNVTSNELNFSIEWNSNFKPNDLSKLSKELLSSIQVDLLSSEVYTGKQDFLFQTQRSSAESYESYFSVMLKNSLEKEIVQNKISEHLSISTPKAIVSFLPDENALNSVLLPNKYNLQVVSYDSRIGASEIKTSLLGKFGPLNTHHIEKTKFLELRLRNEDLLAYGIDRQSLIEHLKLKFGSQGIFSIDEGGIDKEVIFAPETPDLNSILKSKYVTRSGDIFSISNLIDIGVLEHKKAIEADIDGIADVLEIEAKNPKEIISHIQTAYPDAYIRFKGDHIKTQKINKEIYFTLFIIIVILYLILSIQFESLLIPLIILAELPIALSFSLIVLFLTGHSLNIMSFIGLLVMCGIVVNDSILKLDLIIKLKRSGIPINDAVGIAGERRINAILMTTLTTVCSIIPFLFQTDISSQIQIPEMIPLISGLVVGTFASIFLIPLLFVRLSK